MDPDDAPPEPAPELTEEDVGYGVTLLDTIRRGGPAALVAEAEAIAAIAGESDISDTPYMQDLKGYDLRAYKEALQWRPAVLARLQLIPDVKLAALGARVARSTVYKHRQEDPAFNAAVIDAEETGAAIVYGRVHSRAVDGDMIPHLHQGVVVHHQRKFDTALQLAVLRAHYPDKFATQSNVKVTGKMAVAIGVAAPDAMHEIVQTLSPLMAARHLASLTGQRPPELPNQGGFIRLEDAKQAKATEVTE